MEKQTSTLKKILHPIVFVLFFSFLVMGCGGGDSGGDSDGTTPTPSSNWDAMVWDQGNWE